ncbi:MAG: hypothetical protein EOS38_07770 [Mesorhizobium sp.]|nr:hypothetical protein EOA38_07935 [Mesorhizobium sp. M1E.F.Ca.ET.041.01.1.1]RWD88093.1 MAG: hypothetical protein EOS39_23760 [Mesorhizobium sp.]RWD90919.1 MAG: hypothetical protein EOS38_07770 [Mesorhizobium sp.]TIV53243.1 MAG: hypothetical protein E5V88_09650 [Mesorhizobium sp.]
MGSSAFRCTAQLFALRAVQLFTETPNCSKYLFLRNSGRKTVTHFSWNCSSDPRRSRRAKGRGCGA